MNIQRVWDDFLSIVTEEAGSRVVETWLKAVTFKEWDATNHIAYLAAPNTFVREWINTKYTTLIETHLKRLLHVNALRIILLELNEEPAKEAEKSLSAHFIASPPVPSTPVQSRIATPVVQTTRQPSIAQNYTFSSFVVGSHNQMAYAAAQAICTQLGQLYNPLYIFGPSGLGKTHLLHAIGNEVRAQNKRAVVAYQTADRFMNEFIQAIRFDKVQAFKDKYRQVDLLLVDDIQSIAGKDQTQEAFFHVFNTLYENNKQLVLTSDTYPREMAGITARLKSRLEWGLVTDIGVPTLETRVAILQKKAEVSATPIDQDTLAFIAEHAQHNIRELEGAFIRVMAFSSLTGKPISLELAQKVLGMPPAKVEPVRSRVLTPDDIAHEIEKEYGYSLAQLRSPSRHKGISLCRQIAMFLIKKHTREPLSFIANYLRRSDHTTIMHGIQKIESVITQDLATKQRVESIERRILSK